MTLKEQKLAAKEFAAKWAGKGYEKGECQTFWLTLLRDVFAIARPEEWLTFEQSVPTGFIDVWIPKTGVIIEQKGLDKGLDNKEVLKQALQYAGGLPAALTPRWVILCNFQEFRIYDRNELEMKPVVIALKDLQKKVGTLSFLIETNAAPVKISHEVAVSKAAGRVVGRLYNALLKKYDERNIPVDEKARKSLNVFCVRTVFCAYAEDAALFEKDQFVNYLRQFDAAALRDRMLQLFRMLNTPPEKRDPFERDDLKAFPFVSSALFEDMDISVPQFDDEIRTIILDEMSADFDWSEISPTIFGAIFESTLNPEVRHDEGMHYTTPENIHRVIDPLFLDDLKAELAEIRAETTPRTRNRKLEAFQEKLGSLTFLDPACGSGNFLTETFISLRRLENEAIELRQRGQTEFDLDGSAIHVKIEQFYGIELQDFAVTVAMSALWIAESQMMTETQEILHKTLQFLPLKSYSHIVKGNALRMNWCELSNTGYFDYIMGNPPFIGYSNQSPEQKSDMLDLWKDEKGRPYKTAGKIDYVTAWYWKAAELMQGTTTRGAFVSTNSITQGEQVAAVWKPLKERFGLEIDFAWKTFVWDSEATEKAHVHVVVIGFGVNADGRQNDALLPRRLASRNSAETKWLFEGEGKKVAARHINGYLVDADDVWVESRTKPLCDVPEIKSGGKPVEGGYLIFTEKEKEEFVRSEPLSEKWFRFFMGAEDFLYNKPRYCLWLLDASPKELRAMPQVLKRIEQVKIFRRGSVKAATRDAANTPTRFMEIKQPDSDYLMVPAVSSEKREYVPLGLLSKNVVASNLANYISGASLYHFGVLTSSVHMAWMRTVCGRLEMRYRYSAAIVYNNFPWPRPEESVGEARSSAEAVAKASLPTIGVNSLGVKNKITETAQAILGARAKYPDSSLADLYDPLTMPPELRKAHQANDAAVMEAYGFDKNLTESEIVSELFKRYAELVKQHGH